MDRDDFYAQTSDSLAITPAPALAIDLHNLTESARRWYDAVKWAMLNLHRDVQLGNAKRKACGIWAEQLGTHQGLELSAERLRKIYDLWTKQGDSALINRRLCGAGPERKLLPECIVDQYWAIYLDMKDKASEAAAWRALMDRLTSGSRLNGGLTWQTLYMKLHSGADVPQTCPWNHHNPPPGWSLSNFTRNGKPSDVVKALALRGIGAAKAVLAQQAGVRIDWASLRLGECYMIDDHDVDFRCLVGGQQVRLRLIVLIEVRTRRVMAYVVRPRTKDEDGTESSITRRDVQHLLAGWLATYGLPRDYPAYLHCENAAAAVSADFQALLHRVTGGRLHIDRTALYSGVCQMASFRQSGGTPTGKAPIESKFRLFDIELAHVRGATGRNYIYKPGEHQGRLQAAAQMVERVRALPDIAQSDIAQMVQAGTMKFPFASVWEAHEEIHLAIQRMDARTWHDMEGFLRIQEFRMDPQGTTYYPLHPALFQNLSKESQEVVQEFLTYPDNLQNRFLGWGRERSESSAECWLRLMKDTPFVKISENGLADLLLDSQTAVWPGTGAVRLEIGGQRLEFRGNLLNAPAKEKLRFRFNADHPRMVWAQDLAGRTLGTLHRSERAHYHDADHQRDLAEFKAVALARGIQEVRRLELSNPDAIAALQDQENAAAILNAFESEHAAPRPVATLQSELSDELMGEISGAHASAAAASSNETAAQRYLRKKQNP